METVTKDNTYDEMNKQDINENLGKNNEIEFHGTVKSEMNHHCTKGVA